MAYANNVCVLAIEKNCNVSMGRHLANSIFIFLYPPQAFVIFCGLGINNTMMYNQVKKTWAKQSVALDVSHYHCCCRTFLVLHLHLSQCIFIYRLYRLNLQCPILSLHMYFQPTVICLPTINISAILNNS